LSHDLSEEASRALAQRRSATFLAVVTVWWLVSGAGSPPLGLPILGWIAGTALLVAHRARSTTPLPEALRGNRPWSTRLAATAAWLAVSAMTAATVRLDGIETPYAWGVIGLLAIGASLAGLEASAAWTDTRPTQRRVALAVSLASLPLGVGALQGGPAWQLPLAMGSAIAVAAVLLDLWDVTVTERVLATRVWAIRDEVQEVDARQVHQLKNLSRRALDDLETSPLNATRRTLRRLGIAISASEASMRAGADSSTRGAREVVEAIDRLSLDPDRSVYVVADLEPRSLSSGDSELLSIVVGDLVSNALEADSGQTDVAVICHWSDKDAHIRIEVTCRCGNPVPPPAEGSSLVSLGRLLAHAGGYLDLDDPTEPVHTFRASWPTVTPPQPRAMRLDVKAANA
jgi:signal transduction histidine kinase